ncbi:hypothetical protein [Calothrix sp. PCC 6303]|nr:hypothetical protein [Calothrix sp. PCC 6303]
MQNQSNSQAVERPPPHPGDVHPSGNIKPTAFITRRRISQPTTGENHGC